MATEGGWMSQQFSSDHVAGICPEAWDALSDRIDALAQEIREVTVMAPC